MTALPPLIPGDSTVSCGAVTKLLYVYGNMVMPNTVSILDVNGSSTLGPVTATGLAVTGSIAVTLTGAGLKVAEGGLRPKQGTAVLIAGHVGIPNLGVTTSSRIFLTAQIASSATGTVGALFVKARSAGASFTVGSTEATDTSTIAYEMYEVA